MQEQGDAGTRGCRNKKSSEQKIRRKAFQPESEPKKGGSAESLDLSITMVQSASQHSLTDACSASMIRLFCVAKYEESKVKETKSLKKEIEKEIENEIEIKDPFKSKTKLNSAFQT